MDTEETCEADDTCTYTPPVVGSPASDMVSAVAASCVTLTKSCTELDATVGACTVAVGCTLTAADAEVADSEASCAATACAAVGTPSATNCLNSNLCTFSPATEGDAPAAASCANMDDGGCAAIASPTSANC
jgi:hypothetical protein